MRFKHSLPWIYWIIEPALYDQKVYSAHQQGGVVGGCTGSLRYRHLSEKWLS